MKLSEREKMIGIGLGVTVLLVILYSTALSPFIDYMSSLDTQYKAANAKQTDLQYLFGRQKRLQPIWADIQKNGLKDNASDASSQLQHAVIEWESAAGVTETSFKPDRPTDVDQFSVLSLHLTERGTLWSISKLLFKFETATIPVRVNEIQITPVKEGTDDLVLQLSISTLCQRPVPTPTPTAVADNYSPEAR